MLRRLLAGVTAAFLMLAGIAVPAAATVDDGAATLTSFALIGERREFSAGEPIFFSRTFAGAPSGAYVHLRFVGEDGTRLVGHGQSDGRVSLSTYRHSAGDYPLEHVAVYHQGAFTYYYPDGSVVRDGVAGPGRHALDLADLAITLTGSGDSRVPVVSSVRRLSTMTDYGSGEMVRLAHATEDANFQSIQAWYRAPSGWVLNIVDSGTGTFDMRLEPDLPLGRYTALRVETIDTFGNRAVYHPDGTVERSSRFIELPGGPDRHTLDIEALSFDHVLPIPRPEHADNKQRAWVGTGSADLLTRGPDGRLLLYYAEGGSFGGPVQVGRGWSGMGAMTQVFNLSGSRVLETVAVQRATGLLFTYQGPGNGPTGASRQIGRGWNAMDVVFGVQDWTGTGAAGLIARDAATGALLYYAGDGRGGLRAGVTIGRGWSGMDAVFAAGDWDGDGSPDLIARQRATGDLYLYRGNGRGGFLGNKILARDWSGYDSFTGGVGWTNGGVEFLARNKVSGRLSIYDPSRIEWGGQYGMHIAKGFGSHTLVS